MYFFVFAILKLNLFWDAFINIDFAIIRDIYFILTNTVFHCIIHYLNMRRQRHYTEHIMKKVGVIMKEEKGYIQVYTGNGKGKTTAALGISLRAVCSGKKVFFRTIYKRDEI